MSDDLGWNDVSFHGSTQIGTPHIDTIAAEGVALYNYHIQPVCSPTRATILSGRHVIHTGIYMPFAQGTALRLHLNYTLLPKYLKGLQLLDDADRVGGEGVGRIRVVVLKLRFRKSPPQQFSVLFVTRLQLCKFAQTGDQREAFCSRRCGRPGAWWRS
eukprot:COSAG04_NODE_3966_length_2391_cov_1.774869_3_plen_157_part_01